MKTRRHFLQLAASATAAVALSPSVLHAVNTAPKKKRALKKAMMGGTIGLKGSLVEKYKALKAAGFEGVEPMSHMNQDEVVKALEESGLKAASVCCGTHWAKPLSAPDPATREIGLEGLRQSLRDAKRYGATSVLLVPGVVNKEVTYEECWNRSITEIRKVLPLANDLGVKIAIEDVWNGFILKPEEAVRYLNEINSPMVGWHFDIGNVIKYNAPETWIPVLGKRILKLHIKEFSKAKGFGVQFFDGDNNWPAIMKALDDIGYDGWGITEQPGDQTKDVAALTEFSARLDRVFAS
jgi:L-ribulose-5-phosphate 3-epimerase